MPKRPMTGAWPTRVTIFAEGKPRGRRVIDTDSGEEVENVQYVGVHIGAEGLIQIRIIAVDLINNLRFRRDFVVSPLFDVSFEAMANGQNPEVIGVA